MDWFFKIMGAVATLFYFGSFIKFMEWFMEYVNANLFKLDKDWKIGLVGVVCAFLFIAGYIGIERYGN